MAEELSKQILDDVSKEVAELFKDVKQEAQDALTFWSKKLVELRIARLTKSANLEEYKRTEQYAWNAIYAIYAKQAMKVEKKAWEMAEKMLKIVRNALLTAA